MKYVIIGASAAGINAVSTLRSLAPESEIIVISKDEHIHSRTMIHKIIDGERSVESLDFAGEGFFEKNRAEWVKGKNAASIDADGKTVFLDDGTKIFYDKLLITTGAVSFVPPVNNLRDCKDMYCLRDLDDALAIKQAIDNGAKQIVVLGAGLVGMDAAYAFLQRDLPVSVIEMSERILPLQLDEYAASVYQKKFEAKGARFYLSRKLVNVHVDDDHRITSAELDDGTILECDMVLVASGVRPNVAFLENSGIKVEKGIVVDDYMRTSQKDIFAAGDVTGLSGTWAAAVKQAQVAARNMVAFGKSMYLDRYNMKNTMNFFGTPGLSVGLATPPDDSYDIIIRRRGKLYQKLVVKDDIVFGAIFLGDIANKGHWQDIIKNKIPLSDIRKPLLDVSYADFYKMDEQDGQFWYSLG